MVHGSICSLVKLISNLSFSVVTILVIIICVGPFVLKLVYIVHCDCYKFNAKCNFSEINCVTHSLEIF